MIFVDKRKGNLPNKISGLNRAGQVLYVYSYIINIMYPIGTTARTGEKCPESGIWKVIGSPSTTAPIAKGNTMPPYGGKAVTWKLIQYA